MHNILDWIKKSKVLWYSISTLILLTLIYLADVSKFIQAISGVNGFYMSLAFISGMSIFLVWIYVWNSFLSKLSIEKNWIRSTKMLLAANFLNAVTPLGQVGGEPFMAYIISDNTDANYERALSSVISSDMINSIPFVTFPALGILYIMVYGSVSPFIRRTVYFAIAISLSVILLGYLMWFQSERLSKSGIRLLNYLEKNVKKAEKIAKPLKKRGKTVKKSLEELGEDPRHLASTAIVAHLGPITQFFCLYFIMLALGVTPDFPGVYFTVILSGLAIFSPTPGGSGTYEATFSALLMIFYPTIGLETAVAAALLFRLSTYWPGIPIGYLALIDLKRGQKQ